MSDTVATSSVCLEQHWGVFGSLGLEGQTGGEQCLSRREQHCKDSMVEGAARTDRQAPYSPHLAPGDLGRASTHLACVGKERSKSKGGDRGPDHCPTSILVLGLSCSRSSSPFSPLCLSSALAVNSLPGEQSWGWGHQAPPFPGVTLSCGSARRHPQQPGEATCPSGHFQLIVQGPPSQLLWADIQGHPSGRDVCRGGRR